MKIRSNFLRNFAANSYGQLTNVFTQLIIVPLYLRCWGISLYGDWLVISAIPTYFSLAEAGFSTIAANELGMMWARGDLSSARRLLHSLWGFLLMVCMVLLALLTIGGWCINWSRALNLSDVDQSSAAWVMWWLGLYVITIILSNIFNATYRAVNKYARGTWAQANIKMLELAATVITLLSSGSVVDLAFGWWAARAFGFTLMMWDSHRIAPQFKIGLSEFRFREVSRLLRPSMAFMVFPIGNSLYFQGITLTVNAVLGSSTVVAFNTARTLTRVLSQGVQLLKHSAWPEFSTLYGTGNLAAARQLNRAIFSLAFWLLVFASVFLFFTGDYLLALWTGKAVRVSPEIFLILMAGVLVNGLWSVCSGALMGTNQHEDLAARYLVSTVIALIVTYIACKSVGMIGAPLGMLCAELLMLPFTIRECCRVLGDRWQSLLWYAFTGDGVLLYCKKVWQKIGSTKDATVA